ncbi:MAG TPA: rod shape-determining protein MreC [Gammaproteobacteria bacterium]|nr:rod shape-determining protein MreC [Gammaproteobacteria bacterium]MBQ08634.1 rod shape-determining protein MreC [Gammaproteobacteria bacterium]HJL79602.1 rod shape-determining protein MreC [Gammaproteobacteria bacterium]HJM09713.1 rod shape-determining protein MreC [Gammaproteobacteria bacterium]HJN00450.1 rod shape-determining protein MreC [Gammaproteobacteria bacterium]
MAINPSQRIHRYEKNYSSYRLIFVIVISCILMYQDSQDGYTKTLRTYLSVLAYPVTYVVNLPNNTLKGFRVALSERSSIIDENKRLKKENIQLKSDLQEVYKLDAENKRLYELLDSYPDRQKKFLFADIIATSSVLDRHQIIIDKGSNDGVNLGDAVADPNGIIGHVIRDQVFSSEVLLISDLEHAIPIEITDTGERAIAYGTGNKNLLSIKSIPPNSKAQKGAVVITSGLGGRYPEGFPVGEISELGRKEGENFLTIDLSPFANLEMINEIWVIQTGVTENE